jgi:hypothetical protein
LIRRPEYVDSVRFCIISDHRSTLGTAPTDIYFL